MEANAVEKKPLATGKAEAQKLESLGPVRLLRRWGGSDFGATVMVSLRAARRLVAEGIAEAIDDPALAALAPRPVREPERAGGLVSVVVERTFGSYRTGEQILVSGDSVEGLTAEGKVRPASHVAKPKATSKQQHVERLEGAAKHIRIERDSMRAVVDMRMRAPLKRLRNLHSGLQERVAHLGSSKAAGKLAKAETARADELGDLIDAVEYALDALAKGIEGK